MKINNTWTLFLDRDGVINKEIRNDYVKKYNDFHFEEGALEAIQKLSFLFGLLIVITNQRGVGVGLMSVEDLNHIHEQMTLEITNAGGRIDKIYFAPDEDRESINRKPHPTMALKAKEDFPQIDFSKTIMVGNSSSDMEFGRRIGAYTIYIDEKHKYNGVKTELMDEIYDSLNDFTKRIC